MSFTYLALIMSAIYCSPHFGKNFGFAMSGFWFVAWGFGKYYGQ